LALNPPTTDRPACSPNVSLVEAMVCGS
jgi:hypothetical protein